MVVGAAVLVQYTMVPAAAQQVGQAVLPASSASFSGSRLAPFIPEQSLVMW